MDSAWTLDGLPLLWENPYLQLRLTSLTFCIIEPPICLKAHQKTSRGTLSKALSRLRNAIHNSFFFLKYFSCSCLTMNIIAVVPIPGLNPNCISSSWTLILIRLSKTLSITYLYLIQKCYSSVWTTLKNITFSFIHTNNSIAFPVLWNFALSSMPLDRYPSPILFLLLLASKLLAVTPDEPTALPFFIFLIA